MPPEERVLLLRSGRHLHVALDALNARFPGCEIAVVGTANTQHVIEQAGVHASNIFIYSKRPRFSPLAFLFSATALLARCWSYTRVAILWNDPDGQGQGNVDRTAFTLAPLGFLAITPDGSVVRRTLFPQVNVEFRRFFVSLGAAVMLGALYLPAWILPAKRS